MQGLVQDSFSCRIQHHIQIKDKVVYFILIINHTNGQIRQHKFRYSEVKNLHEKLQKIVNNYKLSVYLPLFPGRKLFGKTNQDEKNINSRQMDLQNYMNELLQLQKLHSIEFMKDLLPAPLKQAEESKDQVKQLKHFDPEAKFEQSLQFSGDQLEPNIEEGIVQWECPRKGGDLKVKINRYSLQEEVVNYFITFYQLSSKQEWTFKSRYSEIKALNEALKSQKIKNKLPEFPKRKWFGITNENPEDVEKRRDSLEKYLNELFQSDEFISNEVSQYFLQDAKRQAEQIRIKEELNILRKKKIKLKLTKQETIKIIQQINKGSSTEELIKKLEEEKQNQQQNIQNAQFSLSNDSFNKNQKKKRKNKNPLLDIILESTDDFDEKHTVYNQKLLDKIEQSKIRAEQMFSGENFNIEEQKEDDMQNSENINQFNNQDQQYSTIYDETAQFYNNDEQIQQNDQQVQYNDEFIAQNQQNQDKNEQIELNNEQIEKVNDIGNQDQKVEVETQ